MAKFAATKKSKKLVDPAPHFLQGTSKSIGKNKKKDKKRKEGLESVIRKQHIVEAVKNKKSEEIFVVKKKKASTPLPATNGTKNKKKEVSSQKRKQVESEPVTKKPRPAQNGNKQQDKKKIPAPHQPGQFVKAPKADDTNSSKPKKSKKKSKKGNNANGAGNGGRTPGGIDHIQQFFEDAEDENELQTGRMVRVNKTKPALADSDSEMSEDGDLTLTALIDDNLGEMSDGSTYSNDEEDDSNFGEEDGSDSVSSCSDDYEYSDEASTDYDTEDMWEEDSNDTDFVPSEGEDDLYIERGHATIYELTDNEISFDSDSPQIKELHDAGESDSSCPQLVPIQASADSEVDEPEDEATLIRSLEEEERFASETGMDKASLDTLWNSARFFKSKVTDQALILLMKPIFASGFIAITVVAGELETSGYRLQTGESREIYGVKHFPSQNLTPIGQPTEVDWDEFVSEFGEKGINLLKSLYNPKENAVLLVKKLSPPNPRISILNTYLPEVLYKRISSGSLRGCEFMLQTTFQPQTRCRQPLKVDPEWNAIHIEEASSRVVVVGGKNAGKSTLAQNFINRNVRKFGRVLLVDLDIGQPIVNVAQTVSATVLDGPILGAGYLNNNIKHDKTLYFGSVDVQLAPVKYIECVRNLLKYCHKQHRDIPWIVNTMGMVRGYGLELLVGIIKLARPTVLIQIQHKRADANFPHIITPTLVNEYKYLLFQPDFGNTIGSKSNFKLNVLESCARGNSKIDSPVAKELRTIQTVATLGDCLGGYEWLNDVTPVSACIDDLEVLTMDNQVLNGQTALKAINANLVYLCHKNNKEPSDETSDPVLECFGIGLVRAVNAQSGLVYLLPTVQQELMTKVNVLALGQTPLPQCLLLKQSQSVEGFVPYIYNTDNETVVSKKTQKMQHYKT